MNLTIRPLDAVAVGLYLAVMLTIGFVSARRSTKAEHYFVGHRNFPGWLVGLSLLGSIVSSTTFLALPAAAYVLDWRQLTVNLAMPVVGIVAIVIFIPFFRRAGLTSTFEYLAERFGGGARLYCTGSFIVLQLIRLAIVLFLVALPMQFLTAARLEWVIVGCGVFVALYALVGGMETVLWANAVQATIQIAGGMLCLGCLLVKLPGGFGQVLQVGRAHDKFSLGSFAWDVHARTFWTVAILGVVNWLHIYSGEQTVVQRYVSARSTREARKATMLFACVALPTWTMFFFLGTSLFVFFQVLPDPAVLKLQPEQVLPYFVFKQVPTGLAGMIIAAVLAAAMSALDSGVNSIATVVVVDVLKPYLARGREDRFYLRAARVVTAVGLSLAVIGALIFSRLEKESMNDVSLILLSVLGGCIMGVYMLGFFTRRVDGFSVNVALGVAVALNVYFALGLMHVLPARWTSNIHSYWVGPSVNGVFMVTAYGISVVRRKPQAALPGLTVWTSSGLR